jgi:hypothetical protein
VVSHFDFNLHLLNLSSSFLISKTYVETQYLKIGDSRGESRGGLGGEFARNSCIGCWDIFPCCLQEPALLPAGQKRAGEGRK